MFNNIRIPQTMAGLEEILAELANQPTVALVSLATADGVAIDTAASAGKMAAAAGFLATAAHQAFAMLGLGESNEVVIYDTDGRFWVSRIFPANGSRLILSVWFDAPTSYKRLLAHSVRAIQQMMEQE
jgi:predicted regulator of Ras-like GTPase activity (Roadblock/LC7/MglB family)